MPNTAGRSRGRQGARSGTSGAVGEHLSKIMATVATALLVLGFTLVMTKAGRDIDTATQRFMLFYAGVFALIGLTASVGVGLLATDRIVMTPGHRVMAQAVHRAVSFGALAFLIIHIVTEILAQRVHVIDAVVPFLSPYRTFYIGLGTIASDLILLDHRDQHRPQAVHRTWQGLALAGDPLRLLRGVRARGPARAARRTLGQALCGLELRSRDRADRPGPGGQVPGRIAAAEGKPGHGAQRRPALRRPGYLPVAGRGPEHDPGPAGHDRPGAARQHERPGSHRPAGQQSTLGQAAVRVRLDCPVRPVPGSGRRAGLCRGILLRGLSGPRVHATGCSGIRR